jgi:hypothetical protein
VVFFASGDAGNITGWSHDVDGESTMNQLLKGIILSSSVPASCPDEKERSYFKFVLFKLEWRIPY